MPAPPDHPSGSQPNEGASSSLHSFGRFRFDVATGELWRDGHAVRLAPKPAEVLKILIGAAGQLVTRSEIEKQVWGDVPIDLDRSVNFAIRQIRSALGDSADSPTYVETLPKRGYRFIAPVSTRGVEPEAAEAPPASRPRRWWPVAAVAALAVVAALSTRAGGAPAAESGDRPMLAVLPLTQLGESNEFDFFVSGLRAELITRLARLDPDHLGVIARTSSWRASRSSDTDEQIGQELSAAYLLSGTVTGDQDNVRVNMRLVSSADGEVLWSQRYVESVPTSLELEFEIATRVGEALRGRLVPDLVPRRLATAVVPVSAETREPYLRGLYLLEFGRRRLDDALDFLNTAVSTDSTYAPARAALGRALIMNRDREAARVHLQRAIDLDPDLADPHIALAVDALYARWDQATADRHFTRAVALDPGNVLSHHPYSYHLSIAGRHEEAIRTIETALRLDPVSPLVNGDVGRIYYRAGQFDQAKRQCARTLDLVPDDATALSCLINIHMLEGREDLALPFAQTMVDAQAPDANLVLEEASPEAAMRDYFAWRVASMRRVIDRGGDAFVALAQAALFVGDTDVALDALEAALARRSTILPQVPGDPCFAILKGNPRYEAVIAAMGIPTATTTSAAG